LSQVSWCIGCHHALETDFCHPVEPKHPEARLTMPPFVPRRKSWSRQKSVPTETTKGSRA
jgi:hypothetical protein